MWIVNAQARVKGSCCLSCTVFVMLTVAVICGIGTQHGVAASQEKKTHETPGTQQIY